MATRGGDHVYATLLLSDSYLPGALVLAHSLRDAGTTKQLVVLVTLDTVSAEVITQLKTVYDHVIPVPRIRNERPANLHLMNRPDLHSAFTKVNLWKQTQFSKIVYIDADVLAYRAPDELFDIAAPFSAAPDIGWPDLFNTGVMVLSPNLGDYYALMAMAERGISFDGADQGLLNMHFRNNYNRISFAYNVTPSAHYQYVPAYRHFQSSINMVHFIGSVKPWFQGRDAHKSDNPFDEMVGRWWAVYDRHYRVPQPAPSTLSADTHTHFQQPTPQRVPEIVQYFTKGEFQPQPHQASSTGEHYSGPAQGSSHESSHFHHPPPPPPQPYRDGQGSHEYQYQPQVSHHHQDEPHHGHPPPGESQPSHDHGHGHNQDHYAEPSHDVPRPPPPPSASFGSSEPQAEARQEQVTAHEGQGPPPPAVEEKPQPASPPANAWDAQRHPPPADSKPEAFNFPQQVYEMSQDPAPFVPPERYPSPPRNMWYEVPKEKPAPPSEKPRAIFPWETHQPTATRVFTSTSASQEPAGTTIDSSTTGRTSEPVTPATPTIKVSPSDPWTTFTRSNAWDEVPEIERYVSGLQKHRRTKSQGTTGGVRGQGAQDRGLRLIDFPSEIDRPSLPVTPAPIRRPKFWGSGDPGAKLGQDDEELPAAEGVPLQSDWDPAAQLQMLAKQQSEALLRKLGGNEGDDSQGVSRDIPDRPLPYGSEGVISPTYVAQTSGGVVLSPQPVKGSTTTSIVRSMGGEGVPSTTGRASQGPTAGTIPEPSYHGPGAAWEKGEDVPTHETPALPRDDDRDVFDA